MYYTSNVDAGYWASWHLDATGKLEMLRYYTCERILAEWRPVTTKSYVKTSSVNAFRQQAIIWTDSDWWLDDPGYWSGGIILQR